ncbi:MAG: C25 family cysteine peptidase [Anaerolineae bacterium]|nr:C25 family cysteine peptidase [Anaerolineae bacterium]
MTHQRVGVLAVLAIMTFTFLGSAAYVLLGNPFEPDAISLPPLTIDEASDALRLSVDRTGIFTVTPADLQRARLPYTQFSANDLSLTRDGEPVPFFVDDAGDEPRLYFYGVAITRSMEAPAVYWLTSGRGEAMGRHNTRPAGGAGALGWQVQYWEDNSRFKPETTGSDPWLGQALYAPASLDFPLTNIRPSGGPGRLTLRVWSGTQSASYPDHHLEIHLNGSRLTSYRWDGISEVTITVPFPARVLDLHENILHLRLPGDTGAASDAIYVDWIRLDYESLLDQTQGQLIFESSASSVRIANGGPEALVFDVTDPAEPVLLTGAEFDDEEESLRFGGTGRYRTYAVAQPQQAFRPAISAAPIWKTSLRDSSLGADYIAILPTYTGFAETVAPLLAEREGDGLRTVTVEAAQIYDEFAYGRQTPEAIRSFVRYVLDNWEPPVPVCLLLVGDGSYEVRNRATAPHPSLLPAPLIYTEAGGYVASDSWYTLLEDGSPAPNLAIGRLPVRNRDQLQTIVAKTLGYESAGQAAWRGRAVLVADDEGRFDTATNRLADALEAAGFHTHRLHMSQNKDVRDAIIGAINQGAGLVNYSGHGNLDVWGAEGVFQNSDVRLLLNNDWLPVYTTFTALSGQFNHDRADSLAETLLWTRNGGIVAAVAPSGRTYAWQQAPVSEVFFDAMLSGEAKTLGEALLQAELLAFSEPHLRDVIHSYNLLGDPALRVYLPQE